MEIAETVEEVLNQMESLLLSVSSLTAGDAAAAQE